MTWVLIKLAIRSVVFGLVFGLVAWRDKRVTIRPRLAFPLVVAVFAVLNTGLYWLLKPVLNLASLGMFALFVPFVLNGLFLYATDRVLKPLRIAGTVPLLVLSVLLTAAHGLLWLGLDYIVW